MQKPNRTTLSKKNKWPRNQDFLHAALAANTLLSTAKPALPLPKQMIISPLITWHQRWTAVACEPNMMWQVFEILHVSNQDIHVLRHFFTMIACSSMTFASCLFWCAISRLGLDHINLWWALIYNPCLPSVNWWCQLTLVFSPLICSSSNSSKSEISNSTLFK